MHSSVMSATSWRQSIPGTTSTVMFAVDSFWRRRDTNEALLDLGDLLEQERFLGSWRQIDTNTRYGSAISSVQLFRYQARGIGGNSQYIFQVLNLRRLIVLY